MIPKRRFGAIAAAVLLLVALAPRVARSVTVSCDSSDGLPDFQTGSDGSSCDTNGDGTAPVTAQASQGASASATGLSGGDAHATASGNNSSASATAQLNGHAQATAKSGGSSVATTVRGNVDAVSA